MLSPGQIQQLYQEGITGIPISGNSLLGWWPLNGNANDLSGNGNSGAPTNVAYVLPSNYARDSILLAKVPTALQPIPGVLSCTSNSKCSNPSLSDLYLGYVPLEAQGGVMQTGGFNGASSYVYFGNGNNWVPQSGTISLWLKATSSVTGADNIVEIYYDTNDRLTVYLGDLSSVPMTYRIMSGGSQYDVNSNSALSANTWYHVVFIFGNSMSMYINGVQQTQTNSHSGLFSEPSATFYLSNQQGSPTRKLNGFISDVQIYNTMLSPGQIQQLYQEGITGIPISGNSLLGWWPLNGNANDYSGNGYNGTAYSMVYPYFSGTYNAPGMSAIATTANEWQALGLANT
jgi:hypothetical protein